MPCLSSLRALWTRFRGRRLRVLSPHDPILYVSDEAAKRQLDAMVADVIQRIEFVETRTNVILRRWADQTRERNAGS